MSPQEFEAWVRVHGETPYDADGDSPFGDLAWRAMQARVKQTEAPDTSMADAASESANGIAWAAFWPSLAAVAVAAICRWPAA